MSTGLPKRPVDLKSFHTNEYEAFIRRLVTARKEAGLTQQELAVRLNKHQSFVSKFERGERRLDVLEFITVCRALGLDAYRIIHEVESSLFLDLNPNERAES